MLDKPGMAFPGVNKVFTNCIKKRGIFKITHTPHPMDIDTNLRSN